MKRNGSFDKICLTPPVIFFRASVVKFLLFGLCLLCCTQNLLAQTKTVSGSVSDSKGLPIAGATVAVKGTKRATATSEKGDFSIRAEKGSVLLITSVGHARLEQPIDDADSYNITLIETFDSVADVVVVAYGTQSKRTVTGSVVEIKESELKDQPVTQFGQQLQGKIAGVQVNQTTGIPGQGISIRIRQAGSLNGSSQPLYIVDGFPIVGDINNINPNEIESFSILKDASATALYGSRASNGVVIITTKAAKKGQTNIGVDAFYGIQAVPEKGRPQMMNAEEFAQYENDVFTEQIRLGQATAIPAEYQNPASWKGKGTDWYNILLRKAPIQSYNISLASNTDKLSTSATIGYLNQDGVLIESNFKRYSARINTEYRFNDRLTLGVNMAPSYTTNATPNTDGNIFSGGIIQNAIATSPIAPYKNADGTLPLTATSPGLFPNPNWYRVAKEVKTNTQTGRILSNAYLNLQLLKGLVFRSTINLDYTNQQNQTWNPSTAGSLFAPPPSTANATSTSTISYSWLSENTLNYKKSLGNHHFDLLAGYTAQKFHSDYNSQFGYGFPNDRIQSLAAATQFGIPSTDIEEWSLVSFVSRLNYNYDNRYILSASFRRDGSSRFASNTKYGNFPAISGAWNISKEQFMSSSRLISNLKIRAGYGLNGNFNIGNYSFSANTTPTNYPFNNSLTSGTSIANIGNANLSWEESKQTDIGADISILKDRISLTYDYFNKITTNMLLNVGVPQESGFSSIADNVGKFKFWGHEFSLGTQNLVGRLSWSTNLNISFIKNKVLNLGPYAESLPRSDPNNGPNIVQIGQPLGAFYGYKFLGVYKNQQDFDASPKYLGSNAPSGVGTVKYADINKDGVVDQNDRTIIGNPNPKFIYGMTNYLNFQKFDFSISIAGSYGNNIENRTLEYIQNLDGVFNVTKDVARRWKSEQDPGDGVHPRILISDALARTTNSRWVSDGSYLTIKNISLGYTIPFNDINYLKSVRIYVSVQQAFVFTKYNGANPEVNDSGTDALNQGIDYTSYPVPRTISFGANVSLK